MNSIPSVIKISVLENESTFGKRSKCHRLAGQAVVALALCLYAAAAAKEPVITKEIREENGKQVEYMFIDGIKVHEEDPAKQPQPEIVTPKPFVALAKFGAPHGSEDSKNACFRCLPKKKSI